MQTLKWAGIWVACGLVPVAIALIGLLPDSDVVFPGLMMPMFMVSLLLWLLAGLVMVATWQEHHLDRRS